MGQGLKSLGLHVLSNDLASYSEVFGHAYIATDSATVDRDRLNELVTHLNTVPSIEGYFTETFCRRSRYFQPENGMRSGCVRKR